MTFTAETPVGEIVTSLPGSATLFGRLGIDFCCGGKRPLAEACAKAAVPVDSVLADLSRLEERPDQTWAKASAQELARHIEETHHAYLKKELPALLALLQKVAQRHGGTHGELIELLRVFEGFAEEMFDHMAKEERVLFPAICALERNGFGAALTGPIAVMEHEHETAGAALARMRELTRGFVAPEGACMSLSGAYEALARLERDTHRHVHKENCILFPLAQRLAAGVATGG